MDDHHNEANDYEGDEALEEEMYEAEGIEEIAEEELTEAQRAEAADLTRLLKQHPEIWIPYEEQVQEKLNTKAPGSDVGSEGISKLQVNLRDLTTTDANHQTYPFLTSYERTKCISFRSSQLSSGAKPYILVPEGVTDAYEIAKIELDAKRLPFIIRRPLPDGTFEAWRLTDLMLI